MKAAPLHLPVDEKAVLCLDENGRGEAFFEGHAGCELVPAKFFDVFGNQTAVCSIFLKKDTLTENQLVERRRDDG